MSLLRDTVFSEMQLHRQLDAGRGLSWACCCESWSRITGSTFEEHVADQIATAVLDAVTEAIA